MHKFLRAAGFSMYQKKKDIEKLLDLLETQPSVTKCVQIDEETNVCEMRTEIAPGIGLSIVGELNEEGDFEREFYFPYVECAQESSTAECSVQRHVEKETYAGMVDESCVGISLIFYVQNFLDYREKVLKKGEAFKIRSISLAGFSTGGKILLPIKKTQKRANALNNIMIPQFTATIKYITEVLEEKEREDFSRLKVIKKQRDG